ncbi:DUF1062 domain-containing protein [Kibdelosporangium philippinense]|uniref:DUF1062 domain-containing protein n=1 Tax=Kibdelosporangium philippinense TaxID=211113 RepID=A0ABS8Z7J7_9PSEU|nr:DUF1062 domain-containing protein [Kibdelosporangium philippinense]MCE7003028.1 DUF1062 domain-containing protein [Kibdelosporangium philippinense]
MSSTRVPADVDWKSLWVISELGLPAIVKPCVSCRSTRHHPTGKIRMNANGKLLDVWLLIGCEQCGRTSKIAVHERIHVHALDHDRLLTFENNDPAMVRELVLGAGHRLDWTGTWQLHTDMPFYELAPDDPALEVLVRFELPAPIRVEKLLTSGFGLSRSAVRGMVGSGRIRLPMALDAKAREDFTLYVAGADEPDTGRAQPTP